MSRLPSFDSAITFLEAQLFALDEKRHRVQRALDALREISGEPIADGAETKPARRATKRAVRASTRPSGETNTPTGDTARPTNALSEAAIRMALKNGHDTPKAIERATKRPRWKVLNALKTMLAAGTVTKTGQRRAVRYSLTT